MTEEILRNSSTCRCCLSQMSHFTDIFISHENFNTAEGLRNICGINIYPEDNLPHVICEKCFDILKSCHNFRIKTQQTDQTLHNILAGNIALVKDVEDCVPSENIADDSHKLDALQIEDSDDGLQCPCCSKKFTHKRNLQIHKQRHFMIGKYACPSCTQRFHTKFDLLRHSSTAHGEKKPYKCDECDKRFPTKPELNRHEKLMHNPSKNFSCSECGMQFKLKANARQHIDFVHHKQKDHICDICGRAFAFASKLKIHKKSFKCQRMAHQVFEVV